MPVKRETESLRIGLPSVDAPQGRALHLHRCSMNQVQRTSEIAVCRGPHVRRAKHSTSR